MKIAKPAEDFGRMRFYSALKAKMHPRVWFDFDQATIVDARGMRATSLMQDQVSWALNTLDKILRGGDIVFVGFDASMKPILHSSDFPCDPLGLFSTEEIALYSDAARIAIESGGPIEFRPSCPFSDNMSKRVDQLKGKKTLIAIPMYAHSSSVDARSKEDSLVGVVCYLRPIEYPSLTETVWMQTFYLLCEYSTSICRSSQRCKADFVCHPLPESGSHVMKSWQDGIHCLTRESLDQTVNDTQLQTLDHAIIWLKKAIAGLGYADAWNIKPDILLRSIEKSTSRHHADEVSRTASGSASEITKTAKDSHWGTTVINILNTMGSIFEQTPAVYFAEVNCMQNESIKRPDEFYAIHSTAVPSLQSEEQKALQVLAFWVGLTGEALYLEPSKECNGVLQLIRAATTQKAPIFAIPIYGWSEKTEVDAAPKIYTSLHGVFIGFRRENAQSPSLSAWLTWIYTAQHMLSPIDKASQHGQLIYRPIDIDRSQARATTPNEVLFPSMEYYGDWRNFRTDE